MTKHNHNKEYFFCYTRILSDHLRKEGFKPITVAMEPKTKQIFSLYEATDELSQVLKSYKK